MTFIYRTLLKITVAILTRMKSRQLRKNRCKNCLIALSLANMYTYNREIGFNVNRNKEMFMENSAVLTDIVTEVESNNHCRFCNDKMNVAAWDEKISAHLIVTINEKGHIHVHGPLTEQITMQRMINAIQHEMKVRNTIDGQATAG